MFIPRGCLCGGSSYPLIAANFTVTRERVHSALPGSWRTAEYTEGPENQPSKSSGRLLLDYKPRPPMTFSILYWPFRSGSTTVLCAQAGMK